MADIYAPLRAGSDIVFLGGLIRYVLENNAYFRDYVVAYTNAATLITEDYKDTEDLDGLFSGFDAESRSYDAKSWRYDAEPREEPGEPAEARPGRLAVVQRPGGPVDQAAPDRPDPARPALRLPDPPAGITPAIRPRWSRRSAGRPSRRSWKSRRRWWRPRGPTASAVICYAVGWTQHTTGVQTIRAATILQLLLGNIGRPGGGILALRGHASIQGSTDIPTLYNLLPGYLNMPSALKAHDTLADYIATEISPTSYWVHFPKFMVSLLKAWFGDAATKENDYGYDWLPKIVGDHSHMPMFVAMAEGKIKGLMAMGQNPAVGGQNAGYQRRALAKLDWLVVRDLYETETATFWKDSPEAVDGDPEARGDRHRGLPPARGGHRRDGRHLHEHPAPPAMARPRRRPARRRPVRHLVHRPPRPPAQAALRGEQAAARPADPGAPLGLHRPRGERRVADQGRAVRRADPQGDERLSRRRRPPRPRIRRPQGRRLDRLRRLDLQRGLRADAARAATATTTRRTARATTGSRSAGASPGRPTAGSCTTARRPTPRAAPGPRRPAWRVGSATGRRVMSTGTRTRAAPTPRTPARRSGGAGSGSTSPTSRSPSRRPRRRTPTASGSTSTTAPRPFLMKADGKGWLFAPSGLVDGPLPTHYEPYESPVSNLLYPEPGRQPGGQGLRHAGQPVRDARARPSSPACSRPIA